MKRKRKTKMPKERNEAVFELIKRAGAGSGEHGKTKKAKRRAEKIATMMMSRMLVSNQD